MSFSLTERINLAAKALAGGVLDGDPSAQWYESVLPYALSLPSSAIWTDYLPIKANPAATLADALANVAGPLSSIVSGPFTVRLTPVPGVNNTYAALSVYGDFTSIRLTGWLPPVFAPQANGLPSFGYAVRLYDGDPSAGGVEVLTTAGTTGTGANKSVAWLFNYAGGTLLTSDDFLVADPYLTGFLYTGNVAGAGGTSTKVEGRTLVFRPGGTIDNVTIFDNFGALSAASSTMAGITRVSFDTSFSASPFAIPAGVYAFKDVVFENTARDLSAPLELRFAEGASLSGLIGVEGPLKLINEGTTTSPISTSGVSVLYLRDGGELGAIAGAAPMVKVPAASFMILALGLGSSLSNLGSPGVEVTGSSTLGLYLFAGCSVSFDVIKGTAAETLSVRYFASSGRFDTLQTNFLGTLSTVYVTEERGVGYLAASPADWPTGVPTNGGEALDALASRLSSVSSSTENTLVYRPGGAASGNIFSDWLLLVAAASSIPGMVTVLFDNSLSPSPFVLPVGVYSFPSSVVFERSIMGLSSPLEVHLGDGVSLSGLVRVRGPLDIVSTASGVSPIQAPSFMFLDLVAGARVRSSAGSKPLINVANGVFIQLSASSGGSISSFGGGAPPIGLGTGSSVTFSLLTGSTSDNNVVLGSDPASSLSIQLFSPSARYGLSQSSFSGSVSLSYPGNAAHLGYSPDTSSLTVWPSGAPTETKSALDSLAGRGLSGVLKVANATLGSDLQTSPGDALVVGGNLLLTAQSLPSNLGAVASDVNPAIFSSTTVWSVLSQPTTITGLTGVTGLYFILTNTSSTNPLTLLHGSALSLAANQFYLKGSADRVLQPYESVPVYYGNDFHWHVVG